MTFSRHGDPHITAKDALEKRMKDWSDIVATKDRETGAISNLCLNIGQQVAKRLQTGRLVVSNFSPFWLEPILDFIERSASQLRKSGGNADDLTSALIAEVASIRFETLEFEERIRKLERHR